MKKLEKFAHEDTLCGRIPWMGRYPCCTRTATPFFEIPLHLSPWSGTKWIVARKRIYESTSDPVSVLPETNPRNVIAFIISRIRNESKTGLETSSRFCLRRVRNVTFVYHLYRSWSRFYETIEQNEFSYEWKYRPLSLKCWWNNARLWINSLRK